MDKIIERFKEPSTWAGVAGIIGGLGVAADINEAPAVAETVSQAGEAIAGGNLALGISIIIAGILGIFLPERGSK